jgi:HAD superfamily phosphoserine phosphatase-like hydrolase
MKTTIPIPPRPEYTRRSLSSASFQGQLRNASTQLPGDKLASSASADELITTLDGKTIRVIDTKYTIQPSTSIAIPSCPTLPSTENLVATLFRTGTCDSTSTIAGEQIVPEIAVLSFVQIITALSVPYISPRASHRILTPTNAVVEIAFTMSANLSLRDLRRHEDIHAFSEKWGISVVLQRNDVFRRYKRLVVFDMDSTLIQQEVIDEVAEVVGVKDEVAAITARSMAGELDFEQSLRHRVKLLKGVPATVWEQLKREGKITLMPGARELCHALRLLGYKTAVLSGGFVPMAEWVKAELGLDYAHANQVSFFVLFVAMIVNVIIHSLPSLMTAKRSLVNWRVTLFTQRGKQSCYNLLQRKMGFYLTR